MSQLGAIGEESSGDFFLTFSIGNQYTYDEENITTLSMFPSEQLDSIFEGVIEAVKESILNSMYIAETIQGNKQRQVHALPLDRLSEILK